MVCVLLSVGCKPATLAASPARIVEEDPALPGLGPGSPVLAAKLRAALLAKGAAYRPRTRHLNADGSPKYTNRLILESSPYLLQHAHNPVNWYPWGDEAFARAKREGKPIFLSVGYSTCHWCHVMEVESFEDEEIARYLNEHYVAIKVDREERPDIDAVYMSAVESLTGRYVSQRSRPRHDRAAVADRLIGYYGVTPTGNFDGRNILYVPRPDEKERDALSDARAKLYAARARRIPPARDDKILAGWNGLMISALALGGRVLGDPRYTTAAERAADFVLGTMRTGGLLARSFEDRHAGPPAFLEDYAFLAAGLFDLYEASFDPRWLRDALALCAETETLFADPATGGWFATGSKHEKLLAREKPSTDGAIPSGTSVAILNALRAATFTGDDHWRAIADRAFGALREPLARHPLGLTEALLALDFRTDLVREVAVIWPKRAGPAAAAPLLAILRRTFLPNQVLAGSPDGEDLGALAGLAPFVAEKRALGGRSTAYVCERGRCELPTADPSVLARQLARVRGY